MFSLLLGSCQHDLWICIHATSLSNEQRTNDGFQVAEQTPLTAARYAELALEAGLPPGVFNIIQ